MNQLPRHLFAKPPRKCVCQDGKIIEPKLDDIQCVFCRGRSTTEQISTLQQNFEKSWEHAKDLYTCFADLGKVYGRVPREKLWGGVVGVRCWWVPLAGSQVTVLLLRRLRPCRRVKSQPFSIGVRLRQRCMLPPLLFIVYIRVLQTTARGPNPTCEAISPGRKIHCANNEKIYLRKMCWFGRMYHIPKKSQYARCLALGLLCNSLCGLSQKILKSPGLYELDRPSQTRRQRCHCWELQDEPFAFFGWIGTACVDLQQGLQLAFDRFSDACDQAGTKISTEKIEVLCLSRHPRQCFLQVSCSWWSRSSTLGWHSRVTEVGTKGLIHGLVNQTQFCVSFIAPWWRNVRFQRTQGFQFLNGFSFRSSPVVMNLRWRLKNTVKRTNDRDGIFAKSSRCHTSWKKAQAWNP